MKILVTGSAGFIGFHLVKKLTSLGHSVTGIDNLNTYYDVNLKYDRLANSGIEKEKIEYNKKTESSSLPSYDFYKLDLSDKEKILTLFQNEKFDCVCNLAAQAGVRYSIENPQAYIDSNITGFLNILEAAKDINLNHLIYASSSSVYGMNSKIPFSVSDPVTQPVSLYAATKGSNELMAHVYSHLYNISITGLRFFTVYGPWGRPDMAYYIFANNIINGKAIDVFNHGNMHRDFTYIDDVCEGIVAAINHVPAVNIGSPPLALYNLGNNKSENLNDFIDILETCIGKKAEKNLLDMQPSDVPQTMADIEKTRNELGWEPKTGIKEGLKLFTDWFKSYDGK